MLQMSAKPLFQLGLFATYLVISAPLIADKAESAMLCRVENTDDLFKVYPRQQIFSSGQFNVYQLIDGLTVLVINKQTMRFNRLSNLNLLPQSTLDPTWPAEPLQFFSGTCQAVE